MQEKDLRFQRTKKSILQAMTELLAEKNFEQITVKMICERAEISRSGFYLHYTDKYDLVEKYQLELMQQGSAIFSENMGKGRYEVLLKVLHTFQREGQLLGLLISSNGPVEVQAKVKQLVRENAKQNILPLLDIELETATKERYFLSYISNAFFGVMQEWVDSGQKESPEEIVEIVDRLLFFDFIQ